ncbi:Hint domain-containing protein [Rhodovulum sp. YNF3179]|uniref:Hint domain-containing protein n=1 Tax=Rhodovulum sp. YNF3179 TaxID=3425127 RepID=UPI003D325C71
MGYRFIGAAGDYAGGSLNFTDDIDGDGRAEILIGATGSDAGGANSGAVYLLTSTDLAALDAADGARDFEIDLGLVGAAGGYRIAGEAAADFAGTTVAGIGDVDGGGTGDFLIGARGAFFDADDDAGRTYLISAENLDVLDGADGAVDGIIDPGNTGSAGGYLIGGEDVQDYSGAVVSSAGDVDGDGLEDLLIGAARADGMDGAAYLLPAADLAAIDAADGATDGQIDLENVGSAGGYSFGTSGSYEWLGHKISSAGDLDGDTAPFADYGGSYAGDIYLVTAADLAGLDAADGSTDGDIDVAHVGPAGGFVIRGDSDDRLGIQSVVGGDVDDDGLGDLLIGTGSYAPYDAYFLTGAGLTTMDGADGATDGVISLDHTAAAGGYVFQEAHASDYAGETLSFAGDVDGDGLGDLLIGAPGASYGGSDSGALYLLPQADLGALDAADGATDGVIDLAHAGSAGGYVLSGASADDQVGDGGGQLTSGDFDGDGLGDLLIGARQAEGGGAGSGEVYLVPAGQLDAMDAADGSLDGQISLANAPVCFVRGTRILTDRGEVAVEHLRPGDRVITLDDGPRPVVWIASATRRARGRMAPVRIAAGALGNTRDLWVSPQHRILVRGPDGAEGFRPAIHLVDGRAIRQVAGGTVTYFHLMCARHQVLLAEGTPAESFFPGPEAWKSLPPAARAELLGLFPGLAPAAATRPSGRPGPPPVPGFGPLARPVLPRPASARPMVRAVSTVPA